MTASMQQSAIYRVSPDVLACPFGDGIALFDVRSNDYFSLNRSGAIIWNCARDGAPVQHMRAAVASSFGKDERDIGEDVDQAIAALVAANLLMVSTPLQAGA